MSVDLSQVVYAIGRRRPDGVALLGTCFAVATDRLATAFHVTGSDDSGVVMVMPRVKSLVEYQDTSDTTLMTAPLRLVAADPIRDLSIFQIPDNSTITFSYSLGSADMVPTGSPVRTMGFPHANVGRLVLTQQQAHVGARILISSSGQKSKYVVLNTQAREGQSGGPVLSSDMQVVVAILIGSYAPGGGGGINLGGVDPWTLHQTTHAISAEYLRKML